MAYTKKLDINTGLRAELEAEYDDTYPEWRVKLTVYANPIVDSRDGNKMRVREEWGRTPETLIREYLIRLGPSLFPDRVRQARTLSAQSDLALSIASRRFSSLFLDLHLALQEFASSQDQ